MNYKFTKFERYFTSGDATVSITRASALRFSTKFCKITNIMDFNYVFLFYDASNKVIGIQPTHKKDKNSLKITREGSAAAVSIEGFMKKYALDVKIYHGTYGWTKERVPDIGDMFIVNLKK